MCLECRLTAHAGKFIVSQRIKNLDGVDSSKKALVVSCGKVHKISGMNINFGLSRVVAFSQSDF